MWLYGRKPLIVSHRLTTFNDKKPCSINDLTHLNCHKTSCEQGIKRSCDFMEGSFSLYVCNHPDKFGECGYGGSGDITNLICHVTLQEHVIKGSCDFIPVGNYMFKVNNKKLEQGMKYVQS